ncbi:hypothetical protein MGG_08730 [Pyricularia oryzae 70-15]|uniref:DUF6314 domain-containing protein n=1 Tax=Pyricularia oryzae (strain 70-15 / ATCC MYA-4617 / FGSC 8958) TaxID=242507 RepID=G4NFT2_PYRO7|nr:uncharacterized protein MGG_08730 [Pyricularia oryzae 70-15]EHA46889.1 hypothetical protein MGG_08730 [Pyricularia oryzae 70-15]
MAAKTVCVIGYGPSGACAAKYLNAELVQGAGHIALNQGYHRFKVTIFETQPRLGGLWPSSPTDAAGQVHPSMPCNQSRHTVQFSDLAWEDNAPEFPRAHDVGRYLARYAATYLPEPAEAEGNTPEALYKRAQGTVEVHRNARVVGVEPVAVPAGGKPGEAGWDVRVEGEGSARRFDAVVVASGFFGRPEIGRVDVGGAGVPVVPAGQYRDVASLLDAKGKTSGGKGKTSGGKVLVVGSQMSAYEVAGTIARDLSSAVHSPGGVGGIENPERYRVYHVAKRPSWLFPLIGTATPSHPRPRFLPVDLPAYNLSRRQLPLTNNQGILSQQRMREVNYTFSVVLGGDQGDVSPDLKITDKLAEEAPYLAMSDSYLEFVRSGDIVHVPGTVTRVSDRSASVENAGEEINIDDIAAVVSATGWSVKDSLQFLPQSIKDVLEFDEADNTHPLVLKFHNTHHPDVANLGFVGFYRSPYWGVIEMQSRFLAKYLGQDFRPPAAANPNITTSSESVLEAGQAQVTVPPLANSLKSALEADDCMKKERALRVHRKEHPEAAAQYPMGDYAWLMQEFARALDINMTPPPTATELIPPDGDEPMNILTPSRYPSKGASGQQLDEMSKNMAATRRTVSAALKDGRFVARAIFRGLQGEWAMDREITSFNDHYGFGSGHYVGTAYFYPRKATKIGLDKAIAEDPAAMALMHEYLYKEKGEFTPVGSNQSFTTWRYYVYRYNEATDEITVWFVDTKDQKSVDYFFHKVELEQISTQGGEENGSDDEDAMARSTNMSDMDSAAVAIHGMSLPNDDMPHWNAKGNHWCPPDQYDLAYRFEFRAVRIPRFNITTYVKGEKKDYRSITWFARKTRSEEQE